MCAAKFITVKQGRWTEIRREVKVMSVLDHKRLIKLIDAYETKRELIMIMELYPYIYVFCVCVRRG